MVVIETYNDRQSNCGYPVASYPIVSCGYPVVNCGYPIVSYPIVNCGYPIVNCGYSVLNCGHPIMNCGYPIVNCGYPVVKRTSRVRRACPRESGEARGHHAGNSRGSLWDPVNADGYTNGHGYG